MCDTGLGLVPATGLVGSPLSAAATFTPAELTTVANLRALRAMRDALRATDVLAASMGIVERIDVEEEDDGEVGTSTTRVKK